MRRNLGKKPTTFFLRFNFFVLNHIRPPDCGLAGTPTKSAQRVLAGHFLLGYVPHTIGNIVETEMDDKRIKYGNEYA
jgi:hypothetical protein